MDKPKVPLELESSMQNACTNSAFSDCGGSYDMSPKYEMCMLMGLTLSAASGITSPLDSHAISYKVSLLPGSPNDGGEHKNGVTF